MKQKQTHIRKKHRQCGYITNKIASGMTNLQTLFQDKSNILTGVTKEELLSLYYNVPINKILSWHVATLHAKWQEVTTVKKYLRSRLLCAIDYRKASKGTVLFNNEFGRRELDRNRNVFFRIINVKTASEIRARYDKIASSFTKAGDNTYSIAKEVEEQEPVRVKIAEKLKVR